MVSVTFQLDPEMLAELDGIVADGGFANRKELINSALSMVKWAIEHVKSGHSVAAVDEAAGKYHELDMPFLRAVSARLNVRRR